MEPAPWWYRLGGFGVRDMSSSWVGQMLLEPFIPWVSHRGKPFSGEGYVIHTVRVVFAFGLIDDDPPWSC